MTLDQLLQAMQLYQRMTGTQRRIFDGIIAGTYQVNADDFDDLHAVCNTVLDFETIVMRLHSTAFGPLWGELRKLEDQTQAIFHKSGRMGVDET